MNGPKRQKKGQFPSFSCPWTSVLLALGPSRTTGFPGAPASWLASVVIWADSCDTSPFMCMTSPTGYGSPDNPGQYKYKQAHSIFWSHSFSDFFPITERVNTYKALNSFQTALNSFQAFWTQNHFILLKLMDDPQNFWFL